MFQILDDLTTYCSDAGVSSIFYITKLVFNILQIIVPIILIVSASISLFQIMTGDPDDKKKKKALFNKIAAAVIVFFIPILVNVIIGFLKTTGESDTFNIANCWDKAEEVYSSKGTIIPEEEDESMSRIRCIPISSEKQESGDYKYNEANCENSGKKDSNGNYIWYQKYVPGKTYLFKSYVEEMVEKLSEDEKKQIRKAAETYKKASNIPILGTIGDFAEKFGIIGSGGTYQTKQLIKDLNEEIERSEKRKTNN